MIEMVENGLDQRANPAGIGPPMVGDHNMVLYMGLSQTLRYVNKGCTKAEFIRMHNQECYDITGPDEEGRPFGTSNQYIR